jgi:acetyl esterase/lipase
MWGGVGVDPNDRLTKDDASQVLRRAARLARPYWRTAFAAVGFVALATSTTIVGPLLVRFGIDTGIRTADRSALGIAVAGFALAVVLAYIGSRRQYVLINRAGEGFLRELRLRLFAHIQRQSLGFFDENKAGVLVARMTADIESMSELVQWGLLQFVSAGILLLVAICVLLIGTGAPGFAFGLSCFLAAWGLLAWALRDGFDAGTAFHRALRVALGADFLHHIPERRRVRLTEQIHSQEWLWPFRFRRPGVRYVRNLSYSTAGKRGLLDIYTPVTQGARRPVLLHVHGGAWMMGHKSHQGQPLLHRMVELGWVGVSINYRLAPRDAYPAQIIDVKKAIAWVKTHIEEYGGDPDFVIVTGGSAGGHLSLLAGLTSGHADWQVGFEGVDTAVQGVLAMYPVVDLTNRHGIRQQARMDGFISRKIIQQTREAAPEVFEDGSPISWIHREGVAESSPPFFIVQGTHDSLVWVEEVRRFVAEFAPLTSVPLVYAELPRAQHAFEIFHSPRTSHFLNAASAWLEWVRAQHAEKSAASGDRSEPPTADPDRGSPHD